jgi:hypothetical protein
MFKIPDNAKAGVYKMTIKYNYNGEEREISEDLTIGDCDDLVTKIINSNPINLGGKSSAIAYMASLDHISKTSNINLPVLFFSSFSLLYFPITLFIIVTHNIADNK